MNTTSVTLYLLLRQRFTNKTNWVVEAKCAQQFICANI